MFMTTCRQPQAGASTRRCTTFVTWRAFPGCGRHADFRHTLVLMGTSIFRPPAPRTRPAVHPLALTLLLALATPAPASAQPATTAATAAPALLRDRLPHERPSLMVVGTPHLANHGRDVVNTRVDDVLAPQRQQEIEAIVDALARFRPTRIVVEYPVTRQAELDQRFAAYRAGRYALTRDEADQIGLRLAAKLGLPRVYAADWNGMPPGDEASWDWDTYANRTGKADIVAAVRDPRRAELQDLSGTPLADLLATMNTADALAARHRRYFDYAMLSDDSDAPGANWLANWHGRNLRIFARLVRIADDPGDRVLVVYGAGHAPLLHQFADQSGAFRVIDPVPYLRAAATRPSSP